MVKQVFNIFLTILIINAACILSGCNNDFSGLVASNDLDYRLESKNSFPFLDDRGWRDPITLGVNYKFIVVTDTHFENGDSFGLIDLPSAVTLHNAEFVVNLGDITQYGAEPEIELFIKIADDIGVPFYPVIGNHDIYFNNWSVWKELIGSTNYRIDHSNTTLLVLDTANAFFGDAQIVWLENELKKNLKENVFVFTHAPLFTTGIKMQQVTDTRERTRVISMLRDKCNIMFMGHSHQRAINEAGNVQYVTFEDFKSTNIYCVVYVTGAKSFYEFWKLENGVSTKL
ncbi:MAG: metallophosphoesterase [Treponema sp.]|nr:metallophosphoesterase [Treponema sp.]